MLWSITLPGDTSDSNFPTQFYAEQLNFRSDAQRSVKQKERKKQELERQVFNGEGYDDGGFPVSMVRMYDLHA